MSTDDRLTMALYRMEQDDAAKRQGFNEDMHYIFAKALECRRDHTPHDEPIRTSFCLRCLNLLHTTILTRDSVNHAPEVFTFDEHDICAMLRQFYRGPIPHDGRSGPRVHEMLTRLETHLGKATVDEFTRGKWPERLK